MTIRWVLAFAALIAFFGGQATARDQPNIVIIFCDDLGYADLACFGHPTARTPNLDEMAEQGQKWTSFYVAANVCTPSRAALMTGRLPVRSGMCSDKRRVLFPDSAGGLPDYEITIAEGLKSAGYATGIVGKWHLGHLPPYLPTRHGFDSYFGIPYSNDMAQRAGPNYRQEALKDANYVADPAFWNVPLLRDEAVAEQPADQFTITRRYAEEAVKFIHEHKEEPFFLYLAHSMVHIPLFASERYQGSSRRGLFGDTVEEIDWSVGEVLSALRETGQASNTLVVFTSDNGPWLPFGTHGGSAGMLRDGKGTTFEGGMREPTIFWWPGTLTTGVVREIGSTLDLFPTAMSSAGAELPADRMLDGFDLTDTLKNGAASPREVMPYYHGTELYALRYGSYKAHFITREGGKVTKLETPLLYQLEHDPGEHFNVAESNPEVIAEIRRIAEEHRATVVAAPTQLELRIPSKGG